MSKYHDGTKKPETPGYYIVKYKSGTAVKIDTDYFTSAGRWRWYEGRIIRWTEIPEDEDN